MGLSGFLEHSCNSPGSLQTLATYYFLKILSLFCCWISQRGYPKLPPLSPQCPHFSLMSFIFSWKLPPSWLRWSRLHEFSLPLPIPTELLSVTYYENEQIFMDDLSMCVGSILFLSFLFCEVTGKMHSSLSPLVLSTELLKPL